ncbi:MAG: TIGR04283 family arsenosugar biosynthesis glycosyltransferase [Planctomycetota bacterium]
MKISIIIPVINESALLEHSIQSAWQSGADEVVVVDGGSSDDSMEIAENCNCHLVVSEPGRAVQMNAGAARSEGDVVLFLHADNQLATGACDQIRSLNERLQWGGFKQKIAHPHPGYRLLEFGNYLRARFRRMLYGDQGLFFNRAVFENTGGFPEEPFLEDLIISDRLKARNVRPAILRGPLRIDARRWEKQGLMRQTRLNWSIIRDYRSGLSPTELSFRYRRHDKQ